MKLDIATLSLIIAVLMLLQSFALYLNSVINKKYKGLKFWLFGGLLETIGTFLFFVRKIESLKLVSVALANTTVIFGIIIIYLGIVRFLDQKENNKLIWSIFFSSFCLLLFFTFVNDDISIRIIVTSLVISYYSFLIVFVLLKNINQHIKISTSFLIIIFSVYGSFFFTRGIYTLFVRDIVSMFDNTFFQISTFIISIIFAYLLTIGLIILVSQRLNGEIKESKDYFEIIFESTPEMILINQVEDGKITHVNNALRDLMGFNRDEILGKSALDFWNNKKECKDFLKKLKDKGFIKNYETTFNKKDGSPVNTILSANLTTLKGIPHIVSVLSDITKQKRMIEELEILNATKNRLFSIIGHDLRGPLGNIIDALRLINEGVFETTEEREMLITELIKSASSSLNLLENLLNWAKNQRIDSSVNKELFDINEIISKSIEINKINANKKKITLENTIKEKVTVNADKEMITTVVRNLISNAVKFTKENGTIKAEAVKNGNFINISIIDNGIGMKKEVQSKLFKIVGNIATFGTKGEKGIGIGLILCKEIIDKHQGQIFIESEENKGSKFTFSIPL